LVFRHAVIFICLQWYVFILTLGLAVYALLGKTRPNLGKNFLHLQKYALPYTYGGNCSVATASHFHHCGRKSSWCMLALRGRYVPEVAADLECPSRLGQDSALFSNSDPGPESKICGKPDPESLYNFGSSRSLRGLYKCHFSSKNIECRLPRWLPKFLQESGSKI